MRSRTIVQLFVLCVGLLWSCANSANAQCSVLFSAPTAFSVGSGAPKLAIGDFNGDGHIDLAAVNGGAGTVTILLGAGNGTFQRLLDHATGGYAEGVATADFDSDGRLDLVVANLDTNSVSVLRGVGDGTFLPAVSYPVGVNPNSVAVGEFNGDGILDLAVPNFNSNAVSILRGNGNGTFQAATSFAVGLQPVYVAIGDFNGDGRSDLAVANYNTVDNAIQRTVSILLGNGNGTFQTQVTYRVSRNPISISLGDFNGDGRTDLAVSNTFSNSVSVLIGVGNGTFQTAVDYAVGLQPGQLVVGDYNSDGRADFAVANTQSNTLSISLGNGNGTFQPAIHFGALAIPLYVAAGDFNEDGRLDLVASYSSATSVAVLLNTSPSIGFNPQPVSQTISAGTSALFNASVTGTGPFKFQWRRNGVPIFGATASSLRATAVGVYDVQVSGGCNPAVLATSSPACLSLGPVIQGACCTGPTCVMATSVLACASPGVYLGDGVACSPPGRSGPLNACCKADTNNSGTVNIQDVMDFLSTWFAGCP